MNLIGRTPQGVLIEITNKELFTISKQMDAAGGFSPEYIISKNFLDDITNVILAVHKLKTMVNYSESLSKLSLEFIALTKNLNTEQ